MATTTKSLVQQIDAELVSIRKKLSGPSDLGALLATLTTNIATSKTEVDALYDAGDAGTGIGPKASMEATKTLTAWFVDAIATETGG